MNGVVMERPQHMIMRVAIGIHKEDIDAAIETYNLMCVRTWVRFLGCVCADPSLHR